jgi:hypothetical protein
VISRAVGLKRRYTLNSFSVDPENSFSMPFAFDQCSISRSSPTMIVCAPPRNVGRIEPADLERPVEVEVKRRPAVGVVKCDRRSPHVEQSHDADGPPSAIGDNPVRSGIVLLAE